MGADAESHTHKCGCECETVATNHFAPRVFSFSSRFRRDLSRNLLPLRIRGAGLGPAEAEAAPLSVCLRLVRKRPQGAGARGLVCEVLPLALPGAWERWREEEDDGRPPWGRWWRGWGSGLEGRLGRQQQLSTTHIPKHHFKADVMWDTVIPATGPRRDTPDTPPVGLQQRGASPLAIRCPAVTMHPP